VIIGGEVGSQSLQTSETNEIPTWMMVEPMIAAHHTAAIVANWPEMLDASDMVVLV
jgi:hypothetical protein